ncbi:MULTISPECIES: hypothetical protein [Pseudomonas]|uniref:Uncharacterized protein n=1 Tax=Pseudomonas kurunegalensis TaxID=485880 RepID=A0ACC5UP09_9PSED|nr:hypothetical protein [Pseudomonas kurunegalensis]
MHSAAFFRGDEANHHWPWLRFLLRLATEPAFIGKHPLDELDRHFQLALGFFENRLEIWVCT